MYHQCSPCHLLRVEKLTAGEINKSSQVQQCALQYRTLQFSALLYSALQLGKVVNWPANLVWLWGSNLEEISPPLFSPTNSSTLSHRALTLANWTSFWTSLWWHLDWPDNMRPSNFKKICQKKNTYVWQTPCPANLLCSPASSWWPCQRTARQRWAVRWHGHHLNK